jgi:hypothetical protein
MKVSKIAVAALLLWVMTITIAAWFFVHGNVTKGTDERIAVVLQPAERDAVLREMRAMLAATQGILEGIDQGNRDSITRSARSAGMAAATDATPAFLAKLPLPFKTLGMGVHRQMDELAQAAQNGTSTTELQRQLTRILSSCVACHAGWQLRAGD